MWLVINRIAGFVAGHLSVGDPQGSIGIGVESAFGKNFHLRLHIAAHHPGDLVVDLGIATVDVRAKTFVHRSIQLIDRVFTDMLDGVFGIIVVQSFETFGRSQARLVEQVPRILLRRAVLPDHVSQIGRLPRFGHLGEVHFEQSPQNIPVDFGNVIFKKVSEIAIQPRFVVVEARFSVVFVASDEAVHIGGVAKNLYVAPGDLVVQFAGAGVGFYLFIKPLEFRKQFSIRHSRIKIGRHPAGKFCFVFLFGSHRVFIRQPLHLADPFFPAVGNTRKPTGVLDLRLRVFTHITVDDFERNIADSNARRVDDVNHVFYGIARQIFVGATGEPENQGKVALVHAIQRNRQRVARLQGFVVGGILGGLVTRTGVNSEQRKIAGVARPDPVVGIGAEFSDAARGGTHEAHVVVSFGHKGEVLVSLEKGANHDFLVVFLLDARLNQIDVFVDGRLPLFRRHRIGHPRQRLLAHVLDAHDEAGEQSGVGFFFVAVHGPEALFEIIVFQGRMALDLPVAAVVIGQNQTLFADDFRCAEPPEMNDGIFETSLVDGIDVLGTHPHPHFLHFLFVESFE